MSIKGLSSYSRKHIKTCPQPRKDRLRTREAGTPQPGGAADGKPAQNPHSLLPPCTEPQDAKCIKEETGDFSFHPAWVSARGLKGRGDLLAPWMLSASAGSWCPMVTATAAVLLLWHLSTSAANESGIWHLQQQRLCKPSLFQMHPAPLLT